jgi:hypothetical protein
MLVLHLQLGPLGTIAWTVQLGMREYYCSATSTFETNPTETKTTISKILSTKKDDVVYILKPPFYLSPSHIWKIHNISTIWNRRTSGPKEDTVDLRTDLSCTHFDTKIRGSWNAGLRDGAREYLVGSNIRRESQGEGVEVEFWHHCALLSSAVPDGACECGSCWGKRAEYLG